MFGIVFESQPEMNFTNGHISYGSYDDPALMGEVVLGRKDAFEVLLDRYIDMVSRTSYRILCDLPDSEEVTRKVFVRVWEHAPAYDSAYNVSTWIYRITCNLCFGCLRRRRYLSLLSIRPSVYETYSPAAISPEEDFITKETWEIYCRASRNLSSRQRVVYTLCELEELTAEEVEAVTDMKADQIDSDLQVARKMVRQELESYGKVR